MDQYKTIWTKPKWSENVHIFWIYLTFLPVETFLNEVCDLFGAVGVHIFFWPVQTDLDQSRIISTSPKKYQPLQKCFAKAKMILKYAFILNLFDILTCRNISQWSLWFVWSSWCSILCCNWHVRNLVPTW